MTVFSQWHNTTLHTRLQSHMTRLRNTLTFNKTRPKYNKLLSFFFYPQFGKLISMFFETVIVCRGFTFRVYLSSYSIMSITSLNFSLNYNFSRYTSLAYSTLKPKFTKCFDRHRLHRDRKVRSVAR